VREPADLDEGRRCELSRPAGMSMVLIDLPKATSLRYQEKPGTCAP